MGPWRPLEVHPALGQEATFPEQTSTPLSAVSRQGTESASGSCVIRRSTVQHARTEQSSALYPAGTEWLPPGLPTTEL